MAEQNQTALEIFGLGQHKSPTPDDGGADSGEQAAPVETTATEPKALAPEAADNQGKGQEQQDDKQKPQAQQEPKKPHVVPVSRLVQERKEYKGQIADKDRRIAELEQQLAGFRQPQQVQAPTQQAQPPSVDEDPVNHFVHRTKTLEEKLAETAKELETLKAREMQQSSEQQFFRQVTTLEQSFVAQNPDYYEALSKVREIELNKLALMPDEDIDALAEPYGMGYADRATKQAVLLQQMEKHTAQQLIARGLNPVEYMYKLASLYGYSKPAPKAQQPVAAEFDETGEFDLPPEPVAPKQKKAPSDIGNAAKVQTNDDDNPAFGGTLMDMVQSQWYGKTPRKR